MILLASERGRAEDSLIIHLCSSTTRRDARVVEWDGLENRFTRKGNEGSNPSLSALDRRSFSEGGLIPPKLSEGGLIRRSFSKGGLILMTI